MNIDPYKAGLIKKNPYYAKKEIVGDLVAILDLILEGREMKLIDPISRALPQYSICELAITDEKTASPGQTVNYVGYLGFMEVKSGGIALVGDTLSINDKPIGNLVGFDTTHSPNHLNIVIQVDEVTTGKHLNLEVGHSVKIVTTS